MVGTSGSSFASKGSACKNDIDEAFMNKVLVAFDEEMRHGLALSFLSMHLLLLRTVRLGGLTSRPSVALPGDGAHPPLMLLHIHRTSPMPPSSRTRVSPMMPQSALLVWCK